jgi:hypothetical protein
MKLLQIELFGLDLELISICDRIGLKECNTYICQSLIKTFDEIYYKSIFRNS